MIEKKTSTGKLFQYDKVSSSSTKKKEGIIMIPKNHSVHPIRGKIMTAVIYIYDTRHPVTIITKPPFLTR